MDVQKGKLLFILVLVLLLIMGAHWLIRKLINPRQSANHLFLYFLAHFLAIFLMAFLVNFMVLRFYDYFFG